MSGTGWLRRRRGGARRPQVVADAPRSAAAVIWPALLIAVALAGLAVVGVRDLLADLGWIAAEPWAALIVEQLDGTDLAAASWWLPIGLLVVGAALAALALRPRRTTHRPARDGIDLWLTPDAYAAMVEATADRVSGVVEAQSSPGRGGRRIRVRLHARSDPAEVAARVEDRLREVGVDGLVPRTRIVVSAEEVGR